jgi:hypothetical protein
MRAVMARKLVKIFCIREISQTKKKIATHNHTENIIARELVTINSTTVGSDVVAWSDTMIRGGK